MSRKVLIADDVKGMRELLDAILADAGYETMLAADGAETLKMIEEHQDLALVLMDIGMPDMDGITIIKKIKTLFPSSDLKVCFVSGNRDKFMVQKALANGGHDYIVKPIDPTILLQKVGKLTGQGGGEAGSGSFAKIKTKLRGNFWNLPLMLDFWIVELSEVSVTIRSPIPFKVGGRFDFVIPYFRDVMGAEAHFSGHVDQAKKVDEKYILECSFIGMHEDIRSKLRSFTTRGTPIIEEVEDGSCMD